jgi:DNA repair exonuclease SbcCD nuclease subunit
MSQLFNRAACFTDVHFGDKMDNAIHNRDCLDFVDWFIAEAHRRRCDSFIMLGDWHDNRSRIGVASLVASYEAMARLATARMDGYFLVGNHDMHRLDDRATNSLKFATPFMSIRLIEEPVLIDGVALVPWVVDGENDTVSRMIRNAKYTFGHFEFPGFLMNASIGAPDHGQLSVESIFGPDAEQTGYSVEEGGTSQVVRIGAGNFSNHHPKPSKYIFSGHFHRRQQREIKSPDGTIAGVHYIGNAFPHDMSDADDTARGMMVLEWDGEPEYVDWPDAPTYHRVRLSECLDEGRTFRPRATVVAIQDVDITHEEHADLREVVDQHLGVRSFTIRPMDSEDAEIVLAQEDVRHESVDAVVLEHIEGPDVPQGLEPRRLREMYEAAGQ